MLDTRLQTTVNLDQTFIILIKYNLNVLQFLPDILCYIIL